MSALNHTTHRRTTPEAKVGGGHQAALFLIVAWLSGCGIVGLGDERFVATIDMIEEGRWPIEVPDTVAVSVPFTIKLTSAGGGCPSRGETETKTSENVAVVIPYRFSSGGDCLSALIYTEHTATLQFDLCGDARVVVQARRFPSGESLVLDYPVWVK